METALVVLRQVVIMFILTFVGYLMYKNKKITNEGGKCIVNILIYLSLPCVILNSFLIGYSTEKLHQLLISVAASFALLVLSAVVSRVLSRRNAIYAFGGTFSNPGFFGISIIIAAFGSEAVFNLVPFIALTNLGQWSYGVSLLQNCDADGLLKKRERKMSAGELLKSAAALIKRLLTAPFMAGIIIGLFFFLSGLRMPSIPGSCISFIAGLNTPLAMFSVGVYLAQTDIAAMFRKAELYKLSAVSLLVIPFFSLLLLSVIPRDQFVLKCCLLIAASCPVGANVAAYAQLYESDYTCAVETVVISTLLSIISLPVIVWIAALIWG